jgi:mRNA interferase MazF
MRLLPMVWLSMLPQALRHELPPLIVPVPSAGKAESMALCHQIRTIDKVRVGKLIGAVSPADLQAIEQGVRAVHGL